MDINGNAQLIEKQKIISVTQFDSADNFERFRWLFFILCLIILNQNLKQKCLISNMVFLLLLGCVFLVDVTI